MTDLRKAAEMALEAFEDSMYPQKRQFDAIVALKQALAQPEQEPVAQIRIKNGHWIDTPRSAKVKSLPDGLHDLYTAPIRHEWQELYKDEIKQILNDGEEWSSLEFAQAVSDLLREKNT